jgi:DNA-binding NarL/FixJ family response regulator
MNRPRPRARIVVRARDPELRRSIVERLAEIGDVSMGEDGDSPSDGAVVEELDGAPLTPRELEVLVLMAEGLANKEIAGRLEVSTHTAKFHVESLLRKLDAANRAEAVKEGIRRGVIGV